jgi:peptidoglycan hydrolase CwlO-like protein
MAPLITFLLNHKALFFIVWLSCVIVGQGIYIKLNINEVKLLKSEKLVLVAEKDTIKAHLEISQTMAKNLQSSVNEQNAAINKLKSDSLAREQEHKIKIAQANEKANKYKKEAEEIMKRQPPQNLTKCDAANQLVNTELNDVK